MKCLEQLNIDIPIYINIVVVLALLLNILIGIIVILPFVCIKKFKERSDYYRVFYKSIELLLSFYIIFFVFVDEINFTGQHFPEAALIAIYFLTNHYFKLAISMEEYSSMVDPTSFMIRLLRKGSNFTYELLFGVIVICFFCFHLYIAHENLINGFDDIICSVNYYFLYVNSLILYMLVTGILGINIVFISKKFNIVDDLPQNRNIKIRIRIEIIEIIVKVLFLSYNFFLLYLVYEKNQKEKIKELEVFFYVYIFCLVSILLLENLFFSLKTFYSDFFSMFLSKTVYARLYRLFGQVPRYKITEFLDNSSSMISNDSVLNKTKFYYENFVIKTFDQSVNLIFLSLYIIFSKIHSQNVQPKIVNERFYQSFTFKKDNSKNDFIGDNNKDLSDLCSDYPKERLKIEVKSFLMSDFEESLKEKAVDLKVLSSLFLNQLYKVNNNNDEREINRREDPNCLGKYVKESNLKYDEQFIIKTEDKEYFLEILPRNYFNKDNLNYIKNYINHSKNFNQSFLPPLIGAFRIKIDDLKEFCFVLTKNKIKEIKKNYNSWYMIKMNNSINFRLITSSKDRASNILKEDAKFLNNQNDKIYLNFYNIFKQNVERDIDFLKTANRNKFSLLILLYELGSNQYNNNVSAVSTEENKYIFRGSNFSKNDLSVIPFDGLKKDPLIDSSFKDFGNFLDISKYGFEANYRNFKLFNYFMFDNVFQGKSFFRSSSFYEELKNQILSKFDELIV
jgi:hypothetical protein